MKKISVFKIFILISSLFSFLITFYYFDNLADGYKGMVLLPIIFGSVTLPCVRRVVKSDYEITGVMFFFIEWIRLVLMPPVIAMAGDNCGTIYIHVSAENISMAIILIVLEFIVCFYGMVYLCQKKIKRRDIQPKMSGEVMVYIFYLVFALLIYIIFSKRGALLSFMIIKGNTGERIGDLTDPGMVLARQIVLVAVIVIFVMTVSYCKKKYDASMKRKYFYIPVFVALISVCIIVGERRTTQIYTAFCCIYCLAVTYPKKKNTIIKLVGGTALGVLVLMTIYKAFYAFNYISYFEAISQSNFDISEIAKSLQAYFSGPQNVGVAIEFAKYRDINILNFIFDIIRSMPPFSFLVKNLGTVTSVQFNNYIYSGYANSGHLLSSVGYGYACFGLILSPIIMLINIKLSMYCERNMKKSTSYEMIYVWGYIMLRLAFGMNLNLPGLLNSVAMILVTAGLLFYVSKIFRYTLRVHRG